MVLLWAMPQSGHENLQTIPPSEALQSRLDALNIPHDYLPESVMNLLLNKNLNHLHLRKNQTFINYFLEDLDSLDVCIAHQNNLDRFFQSRQLPPPIANLSWTATIALAHLVSDIGKVSDPLARKIYFTLDQDPTTPIDQIGFNSASLAKIKTVLNHELPQHPNGFTLGDLYTHYHLYKLQTLDTTSFPPEIQTIFHLSGFHHADQRPQDLLALIQADPGTRYAAFLLIIIDKTMAAIYRNGATDHPEFKLPEQYTIILHNLSNHATTNIATSLASNCTDIYNCLNDCGFFTRLPPM